jgi:hypothetical protein
VERRTASGPFRLFDGASGQYSAWIFRESAHAAKGWPDGSAFEKPALARVLKLKAD